MIDKYVQALRDGKIISIDWRTIREMLGEDGNRLHECSICTESSTFPPENAETHSLTETEIFEILHQANVAYMADVYKAGVPYLPIETRYFSNVQPKAGPWVQSPNVSISDS